MMSSPQAGRRDTAAHPHARSTSTGTSSWRQGVGSWGGSSRPYLGAPGVKSLLWLSVCWHPAVSEMFWGNHLAHRFTHQKDTGPMAYLPAPCRCLRYPRASNVVLETHKQLHQAQKDTRGWVLSLQTVFGLSVIEEDSIPLSPLQRVQGKSIGLMGSSIQSLGAPTWNGTNSWTQSVLKTDCQGQKKRKKRKRGFEDCQSDSPPFS